MDTEHDLNGLAECFGWHRVASKNPHMISFVKDTEDGETIRLNYYKTGTVQIQASGGFGGGRIERDVGIEQLEALFEEY